MSLTSKIRLLLRKSPLRYNFIDCQLSNYKSPALVNTVDEPDYLHLLQNFSKCPEGTARCINRLDEEMPYDLQIVVPVYNVEKYLRECVDSVLNQSTKYKIIVFLVDDGSPDSCPGICDEYAGMDKRIRVIHKSNSGLSGARNAGVREIVAKYVMFVDSDDRLAEGSVDKLMDAAYSQNADIVQGSYQVLHKGVPGEKVICGEPGLCEYSRLSGFSWGKVFCSTLFEHVCFPEGFWFEDTVGPFLIFPKSGQTFLLNDIVYYYRMNLSGITNSAIGNPKSLDSFWITKLLIRERQELNLKNDLQYFRTLKIQFIINHERLSTMADCVKEAVFNLSASYLVEIFPQVDNLGHLSKSDILFDKIVRDRNYKLFKKVADWL